MKKYIVLSLLLFSVGVNAGISGVMVKGGSSNNYLNIDNNGNLSAKFGDSASLDAFGNLKIAQGVTLFDSKNIMDDDDIANSAEQQPLLFDNQETSGSGTSTTYDPNKVEQVLSVGNTTAGTRVRQSRQRFNYQPGKALEINLSFSFGTQAAGITRREGYFDERNGLFFEDNGSEYRFVVRSYASGAAVDAAISQSNWNIDPLDGTGESGYTLDPTKANILYIDMEWLGVGRVRFGFVIDGKLCIAHEVYNANNISNVYMSSPNLPLRSEITNSGTGPAATMAQICSTVISRGGVDPLGVVRSVSTAGTHADVTTENAIVPLIGIRLKPEAVTAGINVDLERAYAQIHTASHQVELFFLLNPTISGTFTYSDESNSAVQSAKWSGVCEASGGTRIGPGGYIESGGNAAGAAGSGAENLSGLLRLGSLIDGTPDELVLVCRPIGGSSAVDIEASLVWREF